MDAMAVNWAALDDMVIDFCKIERMLLDDDDSDAPASAEPAKVDARQAIEQVRGLIERGCITEAVSLITEHADVLLEDQRILFWLYKQHFIEMLRAGGSAARSQAIECSRAKLGPCALNAYPEAYEEFKRILLVLIYDRDYQNSPVAEEWSEARRAELAATVASTIRARLQVHDPVFSLTLRYLISIFNSHRLRGSVTTLGDLADDLILPVRDPAPAALDSFAEAPAFNEVDVQALAQAAELTRQGAIQSLKFTSGDLMMALKNELSRIRTNSAVMAKLVWEYCAYRGLIGIDKSDKSDVDVEMVEAGSSTQSISSDGKAKRYRWRGKPPSFEPSSLQLEQPRTDKPVEAMPSADKLEASDAGLGKYRQAVQMRQLIVQRRIPEAIREVEQMDSGFFDRHPQLLFQLKQIEFCSFVEAGNHKGALEVARVDLGPLAAKYPEFLKPLKETVMSLACANEQSSEQVPSGALAASVQVALSASLGISEPQLMRIIRACLYTHTEWFKVQMCADPFADLLKINALKEKESKLATKEGTPEPDSPGELPPFEEKTILTVMEWMALPRGDAIQLLADYDGSVEDALSQFVD